MIPRFVSLSAVAFAACMAAISGLKAAPPHERRAPLLNPTSQQTVAQGQVPFIQPTPQPQPQPMNDPYAGGSYGAPPELYGQTPPSQPRDYMPPDVAAMSPTGTLAGPGVDPGTMPAPPSEFMRPRDMQPHAMQMGAAPDMRRRPVLQEELPSIPPAYDSGNGAFVPPPVMASAPASPPVAQQEMMPGGNSSGYAMAEPDEERLRDIVSQPAYQPQDIVPNQQQGYVRDEVPRDQVKTSLWSDFFDFNHEPGDAPPYPTLADTPPVPQDVQTESYQAGVQALQQDRDAMLAMRGEAPPSVAPPMSADPPTDPMMTQAEAAMFDANARRRPAGMREGPFAMPSGRAVAPTSPAAPTAAVQSQEMAPLMPPAPMDSAGTPVQMPERPYVPAQQHASVPPNTAPAAGMPYGYTQDTPQVTVAPPPRILGTVGDDVYITPADVRARPYNPAAASAAPRRADIPLQPSLRTLPESRYAARRARKNRDK